MPMDPQILGALIGVGGALFGATLGSIITVGAMIYLKRSTHAELEGDEIRKRRVQTIYELLSTRYVMSDSYRPSSNEVQVFNTALAAFSVYFANDRSAAEAYDRFVNSKTDDNLMSMLNAAAKIANLELLDTHLKRVVAIPAQQFQVMLDPKIANVGAR